MVRRLKKTKKTKLIPGSCQGRPRPPPSIHPDEQPHVTGARTHTRTRTRTRTRTTTTTTSTTTTTTTTTPPSTPFPSPTVRPHPGGVVVLVGVVRVNHRTEERRGAVRGEIKMSMHDCICILNTYTSIMHTIEVDCPSSSHRRQRMP